MFVNRRVRLVLIGVFAVLIIGAALSDWRWGPLLFESDSPEEHLVVIGELFSDPPEKNDFGIWTSAWVLENRNIHPDRAVRAVEVEYCVWDAFDDPAKHEETGESCGEWVYQPRRPLEADDYDFVAIELPGFDSVGRVQATVMRVVYVNGDVWER
ncbi:MAG: hypothetical protein OXI33_04205 [Chloroflexota bacterium]|nr:hypothetical protein [Chloroflexota bacterium]